MERPSASAARDVFAGAFIAAHAGEHDPPQGMVGLAVPAAVEPVPVGLARRRVDRGDAAEVRERGFGCEPVRVVAGGDEQDRGGVDADAVELEQARRAVARTSVSSSPSRRSASASSASDAASQGRDRELRRVHDGVAAGGGSQRRGGARPDWSTVHVPEPFPQLVGCGEAEMADLVQVLDAHVAARAARDQQRPDRFDVAIGGLRDPRRTARQRRPRRFDRVELSDLPLRRRS